MMRVMLALLVFLVASPAVACTKHAPWGRYADKIQHVDLNGTVRMEVVFRNTDAGCDCQPVCYQLSWGYHPPHDGSPGLPILRTQLQYADGSSFPQSVCLAPGEEATAWFALTIGAPSAPGYVTPSIFVTRYDTNDFFIRAFDTEGPAVCSGYTDEECRVFVYEPAPPV